MAKPELFSLEFQDTKTRKKRLKKRITFYSQFIKKGNLCFDIGANVGNRAEVFLEIGAKVIAVEPQSKCVKVLNEKFGNNENISMSLALPDWVGTDAIIQYLKELPASTVTFGDVYARAAKNYDRP